jgi:hypothetical protein
MTYNLLKSTENVVAQTSILDGAGEISRSALTFDFDLIVQEKVRTLDARGRNKRNMDPRMGVSGSSRDLMIGGVKVSLDATAQLLNPFL